MHWTIEPCLAVRAWRRLLRKKYHMTLNLLALLIAGAGTIMILVNHTQLKYGRPRRRRFPSWMKAYQGLPFLALQNPTKTHAIF